jgi:hypothetical protein
VGARAARNEAARGRRGEQPRGRLHLGAAICRRTGWGAVQ